MLPRIKITIERWKWNENFNLWISNQGNLRDKAKKPVEPVINDKGYFAIRNIWGSWVSLQRVVMITWKPVKGYENLTVDHLDSNKRNCAVSNLEWVTREENTLRGEARQLTAQIPTRPIPVGYAVFNDIQQAATQLMSIASMPPQTKPERVQSKIKHAVRTQDIYCGSYWIIDSEGKVGMSKC